MNKDELTRLLNSSWIVGSVRQRGNEYLVKFFNVGVSDVGTFVGVNGWVFITKDLHEGCNVFITFKESFTGYEVNKSIVDDLINEMSRHEQDLSKIFSHFLTLFTAKNIKRVLFDGLHLVFNRFYNLVKEYSWGHKQYHIVINTIKSFKRLKGLKRYKVRDRFLGYLTFDDGRAFFPSHGVYLSDEVVAVFFNGVKFMGNVFVVFNKKVSSFESERRSLFDLLTIKPKRFYSNQLNIHLDSNNKLMGGEVLIRDDKSFSDNLDVFFD